MDRQYLIKLVKRIQKSEGTEIEVDALVKEFLQNVPDPEALDYLYDKNYEYLTSEEIVDKALNYKPFHL